MKRHKSKKDKKKPKLKEDLAQEVEQQAEEKPFKAVLRPLVPKAEEDKEGVNMGQQAALEQALARSGQSEPINPDSKYKRPLVDRKGFRIKPEIKRSKYKEQACFSCAGCGIVAIFFFSLITSSLLYVLAKTGTAHIPFFTKAFYIQPQPSREVVVDLDEFEAIEQRILGRMAQQIAQVGSITEPVNITLSFSEAEVNTLLQKSVQEQRQRTTNPLQDINIVLEQKEMELFLRLNMDKEALKASEQAKKAGTVQYDPDKDLYLTLGLLPSIMNNNLKLSFTRLKIGDLSLPEWLPNFLIQNFFQSKLNELMQGIPENIVVQSLTLQDGQIRADLLISPLLQEETGQPEAMLDIPEILQMQSEQ